MLKAQLIVLWVSIAAIVLMCVFPPWLARLQRGQDGLWAPAGCRPVWDRPMVDGASGPFGARIDFARLIVQCVAAALVGGGALLTIWSCRRPRGDRGARVPAAGREGPAAP